MDQHFSALPIYKCYMDLQRRKASKRFGIVGNTYGGNRVLLLKGDEDVDEQNKRRHDHRIRDGPRWPGSMERAAMNQHVYEKGSGD